jgi:hypothetical protein
LCAYASVPQHRDGLCHKAVMWFVHHLSANARAEVVRVRTVAAPTLPPLLSPRLATRRPSAGSKEAGARGSLWQGGKLVLPLLPLEQHPPPTATAAAAHHTVYSEYTNATSCQACHLAR